MKNYIVYTGHLDSNTEEQVIKFFQRIGWTPQAIENRDSHWVLSIPDSDYSTLLFLEELGAAKTAP